MCVCVRLSNVKLECDRLKQAAGDQSNQPERLTELLNEMKNDRDKVACMLVKHLFMPISKFVIIMAVTLRHFSKAAAFGANYVRPVVKV